VKRGVYTVAVHLGLIWLTFQDCYVFGYRRCIVLDAGQILGHLMTGLISFTMLSW
jgi:hypothetical protein